MTSSSLLVALTLFVAVAFLLGRSRSLQLASGIGGVRHLNSLPFYYGTLTALWCGLPCLAVFVLWSIFDDVIIRAIILDRLPESYHNLSDVEVGLLINTLENIAGGHQLDSASDPVLQQAAQNLTELRRVSQWSFSGVLAATALMFFSIGWAKLAPEVKARAAVETAFKIALFCCASVAVFTTVGILLSVLFESLLFFKAIPITEFLFGLEWSPQTAIRADQVGSSGSFGAVPLFTGTILVSLIAMFVAVPAGLMSAIYLSEYASRRVRNIVKPLLEVLAGIPTVVYGFFAALTIAPIIRDVGADLGLAVSSESALAAGLVMGVMIIPFVSSLSNDNINAVPQSLRDGALALGATQSETIKQVVIPAALPGIVGGILLAVSRAIGETMIVVMAAGLAANLTANPLESVTTVTVQIVTLLTGDQEFDSPKTLAVFALGLVLFLVTLCLNYVALHIVKKYREQYE